MLKSSAKGPSKFYNKWFTPQEIVYVKNELVILRELFFNRKYVVFHDRLWNLFFGTPLKFKALEANAKPQENEQD